MTLRFLVDEQLPPALADKLKDQGFEADHVGSIGLGGAADSRIWRQAISTNAVLITKDEDFAILNKNAKATPRVVWIRLGNTTTSALWRALEPLLPEIVDALQAGETLIEIR